MSSRVNSLLKVLLFYRKRKFLPIYIQLFSEKCTGQYFKVRDDKQLVFKTGVIMYIESDTYENYSKIF